MSRHQVSCIRKNDRYNPHERITNIGGLNYDGTKWTLTVEDAIEGIKKGKWQFYVVVNGKEVDVMIAKSSQGYEYLKTEADDYVPNNLLSLQDCPYY